MNTMEGVPPVPGACPSCGIQVMPGYPRCPRCQSPLGAAPGPGSAPPVLRVPTQGGTALAPSRLPWIAGGVAALAVVVGAVLWAGGDVEPEAEAAAGIAADAGAADAAAAVVEAAGEPTEIADQTDDPHDRAVAARSAAAQSLEALLSGQRLWSRVSIDELEPEVVVVRTAACDDPAMRPALAEARADLVEAGFSRLRCIARHGGKVFEEPL